MFLSEMKKCVTLLAGVSVAGGPSHPTGGALEINIAVRLPPTSSPPPLYTPSYNSSPLSHP